MSRIDILRRKVDALYANRNIEEADEWAGYLHRNHIFAVADAAADMAKRFGGDAELAAAAGMLHDIADAVMKRREDGHGEKSIEIAERLLKESSFSDDEIRHVIDDAIAKHSCRGTVRPETQEGKCMAGGDAIVHLSSDFYDHAIEDWIRRGETKEDLQKWGLEKIDRDLNVKIFFDDVREEMRPHYERWKARFESLA